MKETDQIKFAAAKPLRPSIPASHYNVIIIGAGPAGLNCAYHLAKSHLSVLILEQNKRIGPKICAGGLTHRSQKYLETMNYPKEKIDRDFFNILFKTPLNKALIHSHEPIISTISRETLGQWQLGLLQKHIDVRTESRVMAIDDHCIKLHHDQTISFDYLVGADGSTSMVRRHLGLATEKQGLALQYLVKDNDKNPRFSKLELHYCDHLFKSFYAWIFPQKELVSIGCGADPSELSFQQLKKNFDIWLKEKKIDVFEAKYEAFPINADYRGCDFNPIFLAGDAAGLASCFTGEGIHQALVSGEEIARKILDSSYEMKKLNSLLQQKKRHDFYLKCLKKSKGWRKIEFELIAILLKNNYLAQKILGKMS